jgi:Fe-S cluster biogenesis protein NfuA
MCEQVEVTGMLDEAERAERREALDALIELMRPSVQADGGDLALLATNPLGSIPD